MSMSDTSPQSQGSLERLGIPLETNPAEGVITEAAAKSMRFRVSRPEGYAYQDVESFIFDMLIPSLQWYSQALHSRDLAVHKLGEELDRVEVDNLNLKATLDQSQLNEAIKVSLVENEAGEEVTQLIARVQQLEGQLAQAESQLTEALNGVIPEGYNAAAGDTYTAEQVQEYINEAVNQVRAEEKQANLAALAAARSNSFTQSDLDAAREAGRQEAGNEGAPEGFYTHEEVQGFINEAVQSARAEEQRAAQQRGYTAADLQEAVEAAVANATQNLYSEADVQSAVETALQEAAGAEPKLEGSDALIQDIIGDDEEISVRAENSALRLQLDKQLGYIDELEKYLAHLEGRDPNETSASAASNTTKDLPPITAEDLN